MDCKEVRELLSAQVDAELGVSESMALEGHLQSCSGCQTELAELAGVRQRVKGEADYFIAPAYLESRINAALPLPGATYRARVRWTWNWLQLAPSLAGVLALAWGLNLTINQPSADDLVAGEVIASHVRSLMSNRVTDVASSDQHTVKPWFNGRLDYAPPVRDFKADGYPLLGGRLDYLEHRTVAALAYGRDKHTIDLYVWPDSAAATGARSAEGYNVVTWADRKSVV